MHFHANMVAFTSVLADSDTMDEEPRSATTDIAEGEATAPKAQ